MVGDAGTLQRENSIATQKVSESEMTKSLLEGVGHLGKEHLENKNLPGIKNMVEEVVDLVD